uniref:SFRICE_028736 n=1 Tax=Spodoptera frugiperda TaxID=7108 RepID=A0A2H1VVF9_SPOFR
MWSADGERGFLAARPGPDPCVRRVAFHVHFKDPSDHHRWGSSELMPGADGDEKRVGFYYCLQVVESDTRDERELKVDKTWLVAVL